MRPRLLVLWFCCTFFIVYVTTLPFNFVPSASEAREKFAAMPRDPFVSAGYRRPSITDMTQNVILFIPFGMLTMAMWRRGAGAGVVVSTAADAVLITGVETLQLFTVDRTSSLNDVVTNTSGALVGALLATGVAQAARRHVAIPMPEPLLVAAYPALLWGGLLAIAAWQPFDADMGVREIGSKVREFIGDPWQAGVVAEEGVDSVRYALFGAAAVAWCRAAGLARPLVSAAAAGIALGCALELSQIFVDSRMPGVKDMTVAAAATVAGVALGRRGGPLSRRGAWLLAAAAAAAAALMLWSPYVRATEPAAFNWLPFAALQRRSIDQAVAHAIELTLAFIPLGFAIASLRVRQAWLAALAAGGAVALLLEYAQGLVAGRYPDVTDVIFMAIGAAAGAAAAGPVRTAFTRNVVTVPYARDGQSSAPER